MRAAREFSSRVSKSLGIEVFPYSVFYMFFEQYLDIWKTALISLSVAIVAVFVVCLVITCSIWSSGIIVLVLVMILVDLLVYFILIASLGEKAIVAGGSGPSGNILSSAELYNSETGTWVNLPNMNKARKMCSGVFMDSKFYVIGGIGEENNNELTCGEVYDMDTGSWSEIPNIHLVLAGVGGQDAPATARAPPLLAFRACGDQLIVIGGPRVSYGGFIELSSWVPDESAPQWNLLARKQSGLCL